MKRLLAVVLLAVIFSISLINCGEEEVDIITVDSVIFEGSTNVQKIIDMLVPSYNSVDIKVYGTGSTNGIASLFRGDCDVAMTSRPLNSTELSEGSTLGIKDTIMGLYAIIVYIHPSNTAIHGLTMAQLKAIYTGEITNWSELGGTDMRITPYSRDTDSGTVEQFSRVVLDGESYGSNVAIKKDHLTLSNCMDTTPGGICFFGMGKSAPTLTSIALDGMLVTSESIASGEYPLVRELHLYYRGDIRPEAKAVVDYMLTPEGQEYVARSGYVKIN